jgi:hypothetical protein
MFAAETLLGCSIDRRKLQHVNNLNAYTGRALHAANRTFMSSPERSLGQHIPSPMSKILK